MNESLKLLLEKSNKTDGNKELSRSHKEDPPKPKTYPKRFVNDSYIQITQNFFQLIQLEKHLFTESMKFYDPDNYQYKVILVDSIVKAIEIKDYFSQNGFVSEIYFEHSSILTNITINIFKSIQVLITTPKVLQNVCYLDSDFRSRISFIAIFNADKVFEEYIRYGSDSFFELIPQTTIFLLICSRLTFHVCLFCERYLNKYKIYGTDEKVIPNFLYHRTILLLSFDDKISFLYETFCDNFRIVVFTSSEKASELLYSHFRNIERFQNFHMCIFNGNSYDESIFNHCQYIIFVSSHFFEKEHYLYSDIFVFFDFSFDSSLYEKIVSTISKSQQFYLFINLVGFRDIKSYSKLRTIFKPYFLNEEHQEYFSILSSYENEFVIRSRNEGFYSKLDELFSKDIDQSYYSEFESLRNSFRKKIHSSTTTFPQYMNKNGYYVDKSRFVEHFFNDIDSIYFTRPRRFGKSLNMSMIQTFFECHPDKPNYSHLFRGLSISRHEKFHQYQGKYPVIFLNFAHFNGNCSTYDDFLKAIISYVSDLFKIHQYCTKSLDEHERQDYQRYCDQKISELECGNALYFLSRSLLLYHRKYYYGNPVIVLVDEYDLPLYNSFRTDYFELVKKFLKSFYGKIAKGNEDIYLSLFVGIIESPLKSFLSGLNNMDPSTILEADIFTDFFGFNEAEIDNLLKYYNLFDQKDEIRKYYNGYLFTGKTGSISIYNPFSVLKFCKNEKIKDFWYMSGSNIYIYDNICSDCKDEVVQMSEFLTNSESIIEYPFETLGSYFNSSEMYLNLIPLLFHSGYLTISTKKAQNKEDVSLCLANGEIRHNFYKEFYNWFGITFRAKPPEFEKYFNEGQIQDFIDSVEGMMTKFMSYFDESSKEYEKGYHNFVLGLLAISLTSYNIYSNINNNNGRLDVLILPQFKSKNGYILEFKVCNTKDIKLRKLEEISRDGMEQIRTKKYSSAIQPKEMKDISTLYNICMVFHKRKVFAVYNTNNSEEIITLESTLVAKKDESQ